ncbi:hypothetical protein OEZ85_012728 [Tetradesmus obliquus]|uniref:Mitochondrial import inner membrane translocase subunit TIM22 n=1 Tax=Tetradesmus obliquus TaxID=3088 RepID=A0ABY8U7L3_TETOB|nr:hypothetical protein OEZ85_012728 [Tetradesmus obliquus]
MQGDPGGDGQQQQFSDEFKLLDVTSTDGSAAAIQQSFQHDASAQVQDDSQGISPLTRFAYTSANVFFSCSALAIAKQIINPANYLRDEAAVQEATKQLPAWFAQQYQSRRVASDMMRNIIKDTSVLMAASATWYGVQVGLQAVRGKKDAFNACAAGTLSAALLGAAFIEPFKASRAGMWAAVGGLAGYYGFQEQQALRAALLQRQQELEQKHMHKPPEQLHTKLDTKLLKQLLEMDQQQKVGEFKSRMQKEAAASKADAEAGSSDNWQKLMGSAPWLEQQQGMEQQQQQEQQESSRY